MTKFETAPAGFWDGLIPLSEGYGVFEHPIVERVIHFQPFFASCIVVQREFFTAAGGWDEGVGRTLGSDFATVLRLAEHTPFGVVSRPLAGIRKHAGNFSADVVKMQLGDSRVHSNTPLRPGRGRTRCAGLLTPAYARDARTPSTCPSIVGSSLKCSASSSCCGRALLRSGASV